MIRHHLGVHRPVHHAGPHQLAQVVGHPAGGPQQLGATSGVDVHLVLLGRVERGVLAEVLVDPSFLQLVGDLVAAIERGLDRCALGSFGAHAQEGERRLVADPVHAAALPARMWARNSSGVDAGGVSVKVRPMSTPA